MESVVRFFFMPILSIVEQLYLSFRCVERSKELFLTCLLLMSFCLFFYFVDRQACEKKILSNLLMPFSELSLRPGESHLSCFNCLCLCERCIEEAKMVTSLYFILFF